MLQTSWRLTVAAVSYTHLPTEDEREQANFADSMVPVVEAIHKDYLGLPEELPQRVRDLADEITQGYDNDYDKLKAIEAYLQENYEYTLSPGSVPEEQDFVDKILFLRYTARGKGVFIVFLQIGFNGLELVVIVVIALGDFICKVPHTLRQLLWQSKVILMDCLYNWHHAVCEIGLLAFIFSREMCIRDSCNSQPPRCLQHAVHLWHHWLPKRCYAHPLQCGQQRQKYW